MMSQNLISFIRKAKLATYAAAGDDASVSPLLLDTKQLEYREGAYFYRDIYSGMGLFVGQELVYHNDQALWSMVYSGGVHSAVCVDMVNLYQFLRTALLQAPEHLPLRGPDGLNDELWQYRCYVSGSLERFQGEEIILFEEKPVYSLLFSGGLLR